MPPGPIDSSEPVFTPEALREIDRAAVERYGLPSIVLMENAARGLAEAVLAELGSHRVGRVLVACGKGNNGGDGLACARHVANTGADVEVVLVEPGATPSPDHSVNLRTVRAMGLPVQEGWPAQTARVALVVDCVLGTGVRGSVGGVLADAIDAINRLGDDGAAVVAADLPSGMDAVTGEGRATGRTSAVRAATTVTFVGLKPGLLTAPGRSLAGRVVVVGIGCPAELVREFGVNPGGRGP
jgi:hydroxyethylthiazole kinase-like uncharacterized protein yjeF